MGRGECFDQGGLVGLQLAELGRDTEGVDEAVMHRCGGAEQHAVVDDALGESRWSRGLTDPTGLFVGDVGDARCHQRAECDGHTTGAEDSTAAHRLVGERDVWGLGLVHLSHFTG